MGSPDACPRDEARWHRSSQCKDGHCVEVAVRGDVVLLRDSKNPDRPAIPLAFSDWSAFLVRMRNAVWGDSFDLAVPIGTGLPQMPPIEWSFESEPPLERNHPTMECL